jgi:hypothetical protein
MRLIAMLVLLSSSLLVGCSTPCTEAKSAADTYNQKACGGTAKQSFNQTTCDQNVSKCTSADDKVIQSYSVCVNNLDTCTSGNESQWNTAAFACLVGLTGVSSACSSAFK